jgi:multimeric flavodoxin WrbA
VNDQETSAPHAPHAPRDDAIVLINGSPRADGQCARLTRALTDALQQHGMPVVAFNISEGRYLPCLGCQTCTQRGECVQTSDDTARMQPYLERAAGLIWVSPLYFASISAQLKGIVDRQMVYWCRRNLPKPAEIHPAPPQGRPAAAFLVAGSDDPLTPVALTPLRYASTVLGFDLNVTRGYSGLDDDTNTGADDNGSDGHSFDDFIEGASAEVCQLFAAVSAAPTVTAPPPSLP